MAIKNTKKYLKSLLVVVLVGLNIGFYVSYAQESTDALLEPVPVTTTPGDEPDPEPSSSSVDDGGFLSEVIDFVEEVIDGEEETPPIVDPVVEPEPIIAPEVLKESIPNVVVNKPLIPFRGKVEKNKNEIDYTNASYSCETRPFYVNVRSGDMSVVLKIKNTNHVVGQARNLLVGELPYGFNVVFNNDSFSKNISGEESEFVLKIIKSSDAQKGSFIVPIFYSVNRITAVCQINILNHE